MSAATPSRIRAWSSAARTRITLGLVSAFGPLPIRSLNLLSPEAAPRFGFAVRNGGRNKQHDFRPGPLFGPDFQLPAKALGAFAHTGHSPVSSARALIGNMRINPISVVSHVQQKLRIPVRNFRFDLLRVGMPEGVSQGLTRNSIDFVAQHGIESSLFSFHEDTHARNIAVAALCGQLLAECGQCLCNVAFADDRLAQV